MAATKCRQIDEIAFTLLLGASLLFAVGRGGVSGAASFPLRKVNFAVLQVKEPRRIGINVLRQVQVRQNEV